MPPRKRKANKSKAKVPEVANDETNDQQTAEMVPDVHDDPDDIGGLDGGNNADVDNDVDIDHDDAAIHGQPEKKKRIYKTTNLTEDQEADMVEWLKSNPILFNNRMKGFREKIPKQQLWEEQARRLGKTANELETWYSSLRTRYTRIKNANTKSGSGVPDMTDRDKWVWALQWRHNERDSLSNHQPHDCLLNRLFGRRSKKTSKLRVTGLCAGNSPGTGEFSAHMASNAENVSIWWRHHGKTSNFWSPISVMSRGGTLWV